jgi:hypothetical protein
VTGVGKKQPSDLWTRRRAYAAYFPVGEQGRRAGGRAGAGGDAGAGGASRRPAASARSRRGSGLGMGRSCCCGEADGDSVGLG